MYINTYVNTYIYKIHKKMLMMENKYTFQIDIVFFFPLYMFLF